MYVCIILQLEQKYTENHMGPKDVEKVEIYEVNGS